MSPRDKARTVVPIAVEVLSFETVLLYSPHQPETSNASLQFHILGLQVCPAVPG